jgi:hypothetical protein
MTMIDDHDQVWRGDNKARFCSVSPGPQLIFPAIALNLCTLGIPCIYYGSEQSFDGSGGSDQSGHSSDQYIREAMFGGGFGAFRSHDRHCFNESTALYKNITQLAQIRSQEIALKRGRQFLREISGDGTNFGYPVVIGDRMRSVVAWSRILSDIEILCAINTDEAAETTAWVTVDSGLQIDGGQMTCLYPPQGGSNLTVQISGGRAMVKVTVPAGGFVMYK